MRLERKGNAWISHFVLKQLIVWAHTDDKLDGAKKVVYTCIECTSLMTNRIYMRFLASRCIAMFEFVKWLMGTYRARTRLSTLRCPRRHGWPDVRNHRDAFYFAFDLCRLG